MRKWSEMTPDMHLDAAQQAFESARNDGDLTRGTAHVLAAQVITARMQVESSLTKEEQDRLRRECR